jgi:hypothetical protein
MIYAEVRIWTPIESLLHITAVSLTFTPTPPMLTQGPWSGGITPGFFV